MHDAGAVSAEFQFAGLELVDGGGQVGGHGAGLGVGHQATGAEHPAELGHLGHHVRGGDQQVELHLAFGDGLHQVVVTGQVGTGGLGLSHFFTAGDHRDAHALTGAVGQGHGGAELLVGVLGIDAEAGVGLHGFVELGGGVGLHQFHRVKRGIGAVFNLAGNGGITLGNFGHGMHGVRTSWAALPR